MNKVWEIVEKEAREGFDKNYRQGMRSGMKYGMRSMRHDDMFPAYKMGRKEDDAQEAYDCGFEDGYSEAMKKIFTIIKNAD